MVKKSEVASGFPLALVFAARVALGAQMLDQPSFSCASPTKLEAAICADPALAARDRTMAELYAAARLGAMDSGSSSQEEREQKEWIRSRNERCAKEELRPCLADVYDDRLQALAVAALFRAHDAALAEITRQNPKARPIFEALYRYGSTDNPADRIRLVEPLIAPIFEAIHDEPWARDQFEQISDARAVASSDHAFAIFLDVASVSEYRLTLPCAALIHRPGLIDALDALYGGSLDGQLIRADCASTMPPLPKQDSLVRLAESMQPNCQGTIRFSLGRAYDKKRVAVLLHRSDLWKLDDADSDTHRGGERFISLHRGQFNDAVAELATYYSKYFAVSQQAARADGIAAIKYLLSGAFDLCETG